MICAAFLVVFLAFGAQRNLWNGMHASRGIELIKYPTPSTLMTSWEEKVEMDPFLCCLLSRVRHRLGRETSTGLLG